MLYLDTSLLVTALTHEDDTERARRWLADRTGQIFCTSHWTATEVSSALSIKLRQNTITLENRAAALALFESMLANSILLLPIATEHFQTAARFADQFELGIRAADALHLAVAGASGSRLCTRDANQAAAGIRLGVSTELV